MAGDSSCSLYREPVQVVCISVIQSHNYRNNEFYHRIHTHIPVHRALEHKL